MYKTNDIASILEVNIRTIENYITKGELIARLTPNGYVVEQKDLDSFTRDFFYTEKRFANKGKGKKLTKNEFENLSAFVEFVKKTNSIKELVSEYGKLELQLPSLEVYLRYERNENIKIDGVGMTYSELSKKYGLCEKSIENILLSDKKEML